MTKTVQTTVLGDIIQLIKNSTFYNKIQIIFDKKTETFYFSEEIIGHSILEEKDGKIITIQETQELNSTTELEKRMKELPENSEVIIAGNSSDNTLNLKLS